jgi:hypothetical protein
MNTMKHNYVCVYVHMYICMLETSIALVQVFVSWHDLHPWLRPMEDVECKYILIKTILDLFFPNMLT